MQKLVLLAVALAGSAQAADKSLEERVEALEFASYANTISWSGFFQTRYDTVTYKQDGRKDEHQTLHRLLGGIDLKAVPNDKFSVFGRIAFGKFYNNNPGGAPGITTSLAGVRRYTDEGRAHIERFFLNYTPIDWFTFTAGRLPTLDGPPRHILDGRPRLGTYPIQVYSSSLDGYALTFAPKIGDNQSLSIRYILSPMSYLQNVGGTSTSSQYYDTLVFDGTTEQRKTVRDINSWMLDYSLTGSSIARNINFVYQGLLLDEIETTQALSFSLQKHVLYAELNDIAQIGLTAYASYSMSQVKSDGSQIVNVDSATGLPISVAVLSNEADAKEDGSGVIAGLSYAIPAAAMKNPSIGVEYVKGSKYFANLEQGSDEAFAYYDLRGTGGQVYYVQPIVPGLTVRVGYQQGNPDYTSNLLGEPKKTDLEIQNIYANLRADF